MDNELNLYVYSSPKVFVGVVEKYISLIWTVRYDEAGEFELEVVYTPEMRELLKQDYYVSTEASDRSAIIEIIEIEKDDEGITIMKVKGRTIEILIDRRVILKYTRFGNKDVDIYENLQESMKTLLDENIINPTDYDRIFPNFYFIYNREEDVDSVQFADSFHHVSLYDAISDTCKDNHLGFKLINQYGNLLFSLFKGRDLAGKVLFSPYNDNINNTKFITDIQDHRNVIITTNDDSDTIIATNEESMPTGLNRKEVCENLGELKEDDDEELSDEEIQEKAIKKLNLDYKPKTGFDGEIISGAYYKYGKDYEVGDRVWLEDEYGNTDSVYISEIVITSDENGLTIIPTFKEIDWNWEEE